MNDMPADLFNDGLMILNPQATPAADRTIIVTGVARSGTSMVAQILALAGVFMGHGLDRVVLEDPQIAEALITGDAASLARLVAQRNEQAGTWGFKRPHLFNSAGPELAASFRNPHFILTYRDPVAVARRNGISEQHEARAALRAAVADLQRCLTFTLGLGCPVLLVSYEKALQEPAILVDQLVSFCGLDVAERMRKRLVASIEANPQAYVQSARRLFEGHVDQIRDGVVAGWCRQIGEDGPVLLEVSVGGRPGQPVLANGFRGDLAEAGFGSGCHAFALDISTYGTLGNEVVTVRVHDRMFELTGSGHTVGELSR